MGSGCWVEMGLSIRGTYITTSYKFILRIPRSQFGAENLSSHRSLPLFSHFSQIANVLKSIGSHDSYLYHQREKQQVLTRQDNDMLLRFSSTSHLSGSFPGVTTITNKMPGLHFLKSEIVLDGDDISDKFSPVRGSIRGKRLGNIVSSDLGSAPTSTAVYTWVFLTRFCGLIPHIYMVLWGVSKFLPR